MSLAKSNKHLETAQQRTAAVQRNARASSIFEGASARALDTATGTWSGKQDDYSSASRSASPKKSSSGPNRCK